MSADRLNTLFLRQAVERELISLQHGRIVVDRARRLAAQGEVVDVLALTVEGLPANDALALRWLYSELEAAEGGQPLAPPTTARLEPAPQAAPKQRTETARLSGPPSFDDIGEMTIAPGYARAATPEQIGNYEVLARLGAGASGTVYKARHVIVHNEVAIKVLHEGADPQETERFFREARAATVLRHPNLVSVLDLGLHEGVFYLVMELVEGEPLLKVIRREGPLTTLRAASYAEQIARGLEEAHRTLLHRDIKPENILVAGGTARLTDFGLVRTIRTSTRLTSMGDLLGSPAYMSPEQARGEVDLDARCDVYGLGASLYEMLTGRSPFTGANLNEVLLAVIDDEPARPSALDPRVDPVLELICLRCLAKEPEGRFPSAKALADELERFRAFRSANPL